MLMADCILGADIGGTKTDIGLFALADCGPVPLTLCTVPTNSHPSAEALVQSFLAAWNAEPLAACLGVAGPVLGGEVNAPNLPWTVSAEKLRAALGLDDVALINDLVATAYGVLNLPEDKFITLQAGSLMPCSTKALAAPGTGLGEAIIPWREGSYLPLPSEGGHADFAPGDREELALLQYLFNRGESHVSFERLASGPGLKVIYDFLVETGRAERNPRVSELMAAGDPSAVIAGEALSGVDEGCRLTLFRFLSILGGEAGNLALKALSTGGFYLAGGVTAKLLPALAGGPFMSRFLAKGRMRGLMETIPVKAVTEPRTALFGAAHFAAKALLR